ncbi:DinB family protein [Paenibacillus montanisoli]|uniref:DinB family protein n=1 Tax=Paenibacillus montanisoli TaxID=2081970 RepID=UPI001403BF67|nr:DinB family protein [Paenibacillus montanisoli]
MSNYLLSAFQSLVPFANSLRTLPHHLWNAPLKPEKWSTRAVIGHIMLWDKHFLQEAIRPIAEGKPLTLKSIDFNDFNREAAAYANETSPEQLLNECVSVREELFKLLSELSPEKWGASYTDGDGKPFTIEEYLEDFVSHDRHHREEIERFIAG